MQSFVSLVNKVAIVTGGRRGIGKAISLCFANAGANVAICDQVIDDEMNDVDNEIGRLGRRSICIQADTSCKADVDNMVKKVLDEFGKIDILVNNAGILKRALLLELHEEDWDKVLDVNLKGYYLFCKAVGIKMLEQKSGSIINIASGAALSARSGSGAYCISKAGVLMLTRVLARELGRYGIRVNAICPGFIETEMIREMLHSRDFLNNISELVPLGRTGKTNEIASLALFLASDASSYITGATISADGGKQA